jgi:hypothetical protein
MSAWAFVTIEKDTAEYLRNGDTPLTSPRYEDLDDKARRQVNATHKVIRGLIKAGVVGEGKVRISASGNAWNETRMSADPSAADFVGISIGRVP